MAKQRYKSIPIFGKEQKINVDAESGIIRDVVIVQAGIDKDGGYFNDEFISDLIREGNAQKQGVKSRFGHPNMCKTTLGTYIGRYKNFRALEDGRKKAIADLHLDPITKKTQVEGHGISMWDYTITMASTNPDMFGNSIHFSAKTKNEIIGDKEVETYKLRTFIASDLVDSPAATDNLFKSSGDFGMLATQFLDENPQIFEILQKDNSILEDFMERYKKYLKSKKKNRAMKLFEKIKNGFGGKTKNVDLTLADGRIITIVTENESAQVGDEVIDEEGNRLENGDYLLADGSTLVVEDGKIAEIKEPEQGEQASESEGSNEEAIKELTRTIEFLASRMVTLEQNFKTLARSVKSENYEVPPAEDTNKAKQKDLYSRVKEKLNEKKGE